MSTSVHTTTRPRAAVVPVRRAVPAPRLWVWRIRRMPSMVGRSTSEPSSEPSSTTMISNEYGEASQGLLDALDLRAQVAPLVVDRQDDADVEQVDPVDRIGIHRRDATGDLPWTPRADLRTSHRVGEAPEDPLGVRPDLHEAQRHGLRRRQRRAASSPCSAAGRSSRPVRRATSRLVVWIVRRSVYSVISRARKNTMTASGSVYCSTAAKIGANVGSVGPICWRPPPVEVLGRARCRPAAP